MWKMLSLVMLAALCSACTETPELTRLTGSVNKGPFLAGATIEITSAAPTPARVLTTQTENDVGDFRIDVPSSGLVELETKRFHQVQPGTGVGTKAYDIAGIGRYLRLKEDQAEHDRLHFAPAAG